jgi:hypothetical protein
MYSRESALHGLNIMLIDIEKKAVENVQSWEDVRDYATRRIKGLKFSLKVFEKLIEDGVP